MYASAGPKRAQNPAPAVIVGFGPYGREIIHRWIVKTSTDADQGWALPPHRAKPCLALDLLMSRILDRSVARGFSQSRHLCFSLSHNATSSWTEVLDRGCSGGGVNLVNV